jgi:carboxypeptidase Q
MYVLLFSAVMMVGSAHAEETSPATDGRLVNTAEVSDEQLRSILERAQSDHSAWNLLADLCDKVGARLAGSVGLERAVQWSVAQLKEAGADAVWTESVMVPYWERGAESAQMLEPRQQSLTILGLGGTVAGSVEADVVLVRDVDAMGDEVRDRIVLFDIPMETTTPAVAGYGGAVGVRIHGPSKAAKLGAKATMLRSLTTRSLDTPHTGVTIYASPEHQIPAIAVTVEDAASMARLLDEGVTVRVSITTSGVTHADRESHNVIGEIRGDTKPNEIVLIGAHLDSWDVGQGAHDDGAGVVEVIEALRIIRALGLKPKRTIRVVLFTNEENGLRGGLAYAEAHRPRRKEKHRVAVESDLGGGAPRYWTVGGTARDQAWFARAAAPLGMPVEEGGGGADIKPLGEQGVLRVGFRPDDSAYFDVHHTRADTVDKVDPDALSEATAAMAGLAWQLANVD